MQDTRQIIEQLRGMPDAALKQFAMLHKNDPMMMPLAISEDGRRKEMRNAVNLKMAGQEPPKVVDQALAGMGAQQPQAGMQLPEDQGIGQLPAQNLQRMAEGGIAGYATAGQAQSDTSPEFKQRLEAAKIEYRRRFGKELPVTSEVRTRAQQQKLYDEWKQGKKGVYIPLDPAKYPGRKTFHQDAADISTKVPESFLKEFGLHRPLGKKDPVHAVLDPKFTTAQPALAKNAPAPETKIPAPAGVASLINALPISEARAEDTPYLDKHKAAEPSVRQYGDTMRGKVNAPATVKKAAPVADDAVYDPMTGAQISAGTNPNVAAPPAGYAQGLKDFGHSAANLADVVPNMVVGAGKTIAYPFARLAEETKIDKNAVNNLNRAAQDFSNPVGKAFGITESPEYKNAPTQQLMDFIGSNLDKPVEWIAKNTGMRADDVANLRDQLLMAVPSAKLPKKVEYNLGKSKPLITPGEIALREAQLKAAQEAKAAIAAKEAEAKTPAQKELFTPEEAPPSVKPAETPVEQAIVKEAVDNRLAQTQGELFTPEEAPVPPAIDRVLKQRDPLMEQARAYNEKAAEEAAARRAANEQAKETGEGVAFRQKKEAARNVIKAEENVASAERQRLAQEKPVDLRGIQDTYMSKLVGPALGGAAAAATASNALALPQEEAAAPAEIPVDYAAWAKHYNQPETFQPKVEAPAAEAPPAETGLAQLAAEKPKSSGFTNDDWLTFGLNMLQGKPRTGNILSDLASSAGSAGLATLAGRKEREKGELEKQKQLSEENYRKILGESQQALSKTYGREPEAVRSLEYLKAHPDLFATMREEAEAKAKPLTPGDAAKIYTELMKSNPEALQGYASVQDFIKATVPAGLQLSPTGQSAYDKYK